MLAPFWSESTKGFAERGEEILKSKNTDSNGEEAVDALLEEDFDVLLMDIQMPVLDGIKATGIIRKMEEPRKYPCVL